MEIFPLSRVRREEALEKYYKTIMTSYPDRNSKAELRRKTDEVMSRQAFKEMMTNTPREDLKKMAGDISKKMPDNRGLTGGDIGDGLVNQYQKNVKILQRKEIAAKNHLEGISMGF